MTCHTPKQQTVASNIYRFPGNGNPADKIPRPGHQYHDVRGPETSTYLQLAFDKRYIFRFDETKKRFYVTPQEFIDWFTPTGNTNGDAHKEEFNDLETGWREVRHNGDIHYFNRVTVSQHESICEREFISVTSLIDTTLESASQHFTSICRKCLGILKNRHQEN